MALLLLYVVRVLLPVRASAAVPLCVIRYSFARELEQKFCCSSSVHYFTRLGRLRSLAADPCPSVPPVATQKNNGREEHSGKLFTGINRLTNSEGIGERGLVVLFLDWFIIKFSVRVGTRSSPLDRTASLSLRPFKAILLVPRGHSETVLGADPRECGFGPQPTSACLHTPHPHPTNGSTCCGTTVP